MKHFFNLKYHLDKLNYKKVGDILFHSNSKNLLIKITKTKQKNHQC